MARKDFNKGLVAGAKPFEEKFEKQAENFQIATDNINKKLEDINVTTDVIIDELNSIEKKHLYDLNTVVDISTLGNDEKELLMAILYTLSDMTDEVTDYQQVFLRSVKNYIQIKNVQTSIDLSSIEHIENINDQKAILQTVMEFLFLENVNHKYMEEYEDIIDYFSINKKVKKELQECIGKIYRATGIKGISEKYGYVPEEKQIESTLALEKENNDTLMWNQYDYDGNDISELCADNVNIRLYSILDNYIICYGGKNYLNRINKSSGEVKSLCFVDYAHKFCGIHNKIYVFVGHEAEKIVEENVETYETRDIPILGKYDYISSSFQVNSKYLIYSTKISNIGQIVKLNLHNYESELLPFTWKWISDAKFFMVSDKLYINNENKILKYDLETGTSQILCDSENQFLNSGNTLFYKDHIISTAYDGYSCNPASYFSLDLDNPDMLKTVEIPKNNTAIFLGNKSLFGVDLDYNMSVGQYNFETKEYKTVLSSSACAYVTEEGIIKKTHHYSLKFSYDNMKQVVGKWLYYRAERSKTIRKVSLDSINGQSVEVRIPD